MIGDGLFPALDLEGVAEHAIGGCACCVGSLAMRVALDRLLRHERPDGIVFLIAAPDHLPRILDFLSAPRYSAHCRLDVD